MSEFTEETPPSIAQQAEEIIRNMPMFDALGAELALHGGRPDQVLRALDADPKTSPEARERARAAYILRRVLNGSRELDRAGLELTGNEGFNVEDIVDGAVADAVELWADNFSRTATGKSSSRSIMVRTLITVINERNGMSISQSDAERAIHIRNLLKENPDLTDTQLAEMVELPTWNSIRTMVHTPEEYVRHLRTLGAEWHQQLQPDSRGPNLPGHTDLALSELRIDLDRALRQMSTAEVDPRIVPVLDKYVKQNMQISEIAKALNMTTYRVNMLLRDGLQILRVRMRAYDSRYW